MSLRLTLQQDIVDLLKADPYFEDIEIISRKKKDTLNDIQNRVNKLSVGGAVVVRKMGGVKMNTEGPWFRDIEVQVGFCENRKVNATGKSAEDLVEYAAGLLHLESPESITCPLACDSITDIPPEDEADKNKVLLVAVFKTSAGIFVTRPQVATPVVVDDAGEYTLSCATPGAAIFYRTDGKHPHTDSAAGTNLYLAPFTPGPGLQLRVRAWLAGHRTSELVSAVTV